MVKLDIPNILVFKIEIVLYIILGGLVGLIYGLRRVLLMERRIIQMDKKLAKLIEKRK